MGYYKRRSTRKETTAQSLARYKRQQEKQRKVREARRIQELQDRSPGGILNPLEPKWCSFDTYKQVCLQHQQTRYRGTTKIVAYIKGTEPAEHTCPMTGYKKKINFYDHQWAAWISRLNHVQFGKRWYTHPLTIVSFKEFCERYVVYEEHQKYLD